MKQLAAFVAGLVVTGVVVLVGPGQAGSHTRPVSTRPQCGSGQLVLTMTSTRKAGSARSRSADQAVRDEIAKEYPQLAPERLRKASVGKTRVDYALERGGKPLARVRTEKIGTGWAVESLTACDSVLGSAP